jgi:methane monooxygenase PmoA-like
MGFSPILMKSPAYLPRADFGSSKLSFVALALALVSAAALPSCSLLSSEVQTPTPIVSHPSLASLGAAPFSELRSSFLESNPRFDLQRLESVLVVPSRSKTRLVVLLADAGTVKIEQRKSGGDPMQIGVAQALYGDLVHLRPGQGLQLEIPVDLLLLTLPDALADEVPNFFTKGEMAIPGESPCRALGQIWINDSEMDGPVRAASMDRLYFIQDALPGSALFLADNDALLAGQLDLDGLAQKSLVDKIDLRAGALVYLPRGSHSRLVGGCATTFLTAPGLTHMALAEVDQPVQPLDASWHTKLASNRTGLAEPVAALPFVSAQASETGVQIKVNGESFTEFHHSDDTQAGFSPLIGPDGISLTHTPDQDRDWIGFNPATMAGSDFAPGQATAGPIKLGQYHSRTGHAGFETQQPWLTPDHRVFLHDTRSYELHARAKERWVDLDIRLVATDHPVAFKDSDLAGLSLQAKLDHIASGKSAVLSIIDSRGHRDLETSGQRATWIHASGMTAAGPAGLAILEHPANFRYPTYWSSQKNGTLAAHPFARDLSKDRPEGYGDYFLGSGQELHLRYRIYLHTGARKVARIQQMALDMVE